MLAANECELAEHQEDPNDDDNYWNDDPQRSLYAPRDLFPFKPRADVLLVGQAFAPGQEPVRSLTARLQVGNVDKSIDVVADRAWTKAGLLREGPRFVKMPLRYERAAFGTDNPVGVRFDAPPGADGAIPLPNLQPVGSRVERQGDTFPAIGFGPIAPTWPQRNNKLPPDAVHKRPDFWRDQPIPEALDPCYFNSAPTDQQIDVITGDEQIILTNLHRYHPKMITRVPALAPRAIVELNGAPSHELPLRGDTLWIDTDRAICTLTWRGQLRLDRPDQPGRIIIEQTTLTKPAPSVAERKLVEETIAVRPMAGRGPDLPFLLAERLRTTPAAKGAPPPQAPLPIAPPPLVAAPPLVVEANPNSNGGPVAPAADASAQPAKPAPVRATTAAASRPQVASLAVLREKRLAGAADARSAAGASDAAAATSAQEAAALATPVVPAPAPAPPPTRPPPKATIELLWYDPTFPDRIRKHQAWNDVLLHGGDAAAPAHAPSPGAPPTKQAQDARDRRDISRIMTLGDPHTAEGIVKAVARSVDEHGVFAPPMVLLAGVLEFPFDELETLKATVAAVSPLISGDKKLKDTVDTVNELLKTPWLHAAGSVTERLTAQVQEAFAQVHRGLPAHYLSMHTERMLLSQRHYQKRAVFGRPWIRALLSFAGASHAIPAYLPAEAAGELPMFQRFPVRLIAEVRVQLDQYETHPHALRVAALGRVLSGLVPDGGRAMA